MTGFEPETCEIPYSVCALGHIGFNGKKSDSGYRDRRFNPLLHQIVAYLEQDTSLLQLAQLTNDA